MRLVFAPHRDGRLAAAIAGSAILAASALAFMHVPAAQAADENTRVGLGQAGDFSVLAGQGVTNTGDTTIAQDIGSSPLLDNSGVSGPAGSANLVDVGGTNHFDDPDNSFTDQAQTDLIAAYNEAAGALPTAIVETELGGKTLVGGVYKADAVGTLGLTGTLTLDGGRSDGLPSNKVFIFQSPTTLITEVDSKVVLTGGAQACNIFWQVGSAATFKTRSAFQGTVMANSEAITAQSGATFVGRLLARTAAVTLDNNTITQPVCATSPDEETDTTDGDTDTDGTDGTDTGGTDTTDGTSDGTTDGTDTTDGTAGETDATSPSGAVVGGPSDDSLPGTGGQSPWLLVAGVGSVLVGVAVTRRARYRPTHSG